MKRGLFRPEAIESRRQLWLGEIRLARPLPLALLTAGVVVVALAVAAFLALGQYTRKARLQGVLVPDRGVMRLVAPQAGMVVERLANEGEQVRAGQPLFVLSLERTSTSGDTEAAVQEALQARRRSLTQATQREQALLDTQLAAVRQRRADTRAELAAIDAQIEVQHQRLLLAQQALTQFESLRADNFVSSAQVRSKSADKLEVEAKLHELDTERAMRRRDLAGLEARERELALSAQSRQGELEREAADVARLAAEAEARRRLVVAAPFDGVVAAVLAQPGQAVASATELATVLPAGAMLQAHLYAPSSAVGFVHAHQPVLLRYQAFPYQKFGHHRGQVVQVSRTPLAGAELEVPAAEPMYRVTVALDAQAVAAYGQAQPLAAGMRLEADVLLDRRRLYEWLFEPVLGLTGRI